MDTTTIKALQDVLSVLEAKDCPTYHSAVPQSEIREGRYLVRFARSRQELEAALKLRFEVFNLELGEGLESSHASGQDKDEFDEGCHHLVVLEMSQGRVVGTYRMQTGEHSSAGKGFYSGGEFDLSLLPSGVLENSVELGRACIAKDHRNTQVLFLLWKGIASYVAYNQKRYLFGCCSLTSQDASEGVRVFDFLKGNGLLHESFSVLPRQGFECLTRDQPFRSAPDVSLPKLFRIYLRFGAKVCGPPAIDRQFKTIDFFVIFDINAMNGKALGMFFGA